MKLSLAACRLTSVGNELNGLSGLRCEQQGVSPSQGMQHLLASNVCMAMPATAPAVDNLLRRPLLPIPVRPRIQCTILLLLSLSWLKVPRFELQQVGRPSRLSQQPCGC